MRFLTFLGYAAIPVAFVVHYWLGRGAHWEPLATFLLAALGVIPMAHLMGEATEHLAARAGPTWGGLLNATFGNAAELIIALIALHKGLNSVVKASLTGSILGNLLLVGGAAMLAGGWRRERQYFNKAAAETNSGMLALAVAAMLMPAIFHYTGERLNDPQLVAHDHRVSFGTSFILLAVYGLGLLFTLRTHAHIFSHPAGLAEPSPGEHPHAAGHAGADTAPAEHGWSNRRSITALLLASAGIGIVAELLVGSAEHMSRQLGWNHVFVGVILLAIIGNAAEHSTAIMLARRDDMDTAMTITYQSSLQIALFATPVLVLISACMYALGWSPPQAGALNMLFTPMEVAAIVLTVGIVVVLGQDGQTNWFEGVMLLALYAILAVAFFNLPEAAH